MPRVLAEHAPSGQEWTTLSGSVTDTDGATVLGAVYRMLQEDSASTYSLQAEHGDRRIERRLALARSQDIEEYVRRLKSERNELDVLYRDLLIEVTDSSGTSMRSGARRAGPADLLRREPRGLPLRLW